MKKIFVAIVLIAGLSASAQVKIGDNPTVLNVGALLELQSNAGTKGLKFPEVALTSTSTWAPVLGTKVMGMTVYNTATTGDVTPGLYTNNGTDWVKNEGALTAPVLKIKYDTTSTANIDYSGGEDIFIFTKNLSALALPLPSSYINKVLYIRNEFGATVFYSGAIQGLTMPFGITSISGTAAQMIISDGTIWHLISGKN